METNNMRTKFPTMNDVIFSHIAPSSSLPLVISPKNPAVHILDIAKEKPVIREMLTQYGAILFRGFSEHSNKIFSDFIETTSNSALEYTERSSPRHSVYKNIFTSTDHPNDRTIIQHSEQSYNKSFPLNIFFYCVKASEKGGQTPLADARKIYKSLRPSIIKKFKSKNYRYSRYFRPYIGISWQTAFQSDDRLTVEKYCHQNEIQFEWQPNDCLKTHQIRPTVAYHPMSRERCWFNHCLFFNIFSLDGDTKEILQCSFPNDELPNNTYYGDGETIEEDVLNELKTAYESNRVTFDWQEGDILMIDNMLVTHGRAPYSGERSILAGMSEAYRWDDVEY